MSKINSKLYSNNHLNISNTVQLPSNLLQNRKKINHQHFQSLDYHQTMVSSPRKVHPRKSNHTESHERKVHKKQAEVVLIGETKQKIKNHGLYKRISQIKQSHEQLESISFSKLLSKIVIVDPRQNEQNKRYEQQNKFKSISQYSCLKGRMFNMQCEKKQNIVKTESIELNKMVSTFKLFKKYYMPCSDKSKPNFFRTSSPEQKYIYINGNKTQCKRIHNFYTSNNFRTTYNRAFPKVMNESTSSKRGSFKF